MTLEQLLNLPSQGWDALTESELDAIAAPFLCVTRPERGRVTSTKGPTAPRLPDKKQKAISKARELGIDLSGYI